MTMTRGDKHPWVLTMFKRSRGSECKALTCLARRLSAASSGSGRLGRDEKVRLILPMSCLVVGRNVAHGLLETTGGIVLPDDVGALVDAAEKEFHERSRATFDDVIREVTTRVMTVGTAS